MKNKTLNEIYSPAELRAARSERIRVAEAEPYGWLAFSETGEGEHYRLYLDPATKHLACTCGDFIFRGNAEPGYECKHVAATLKFIARQYLANEYDPFKQSEKSVEKENASRSRLERKAA